MEKTRLRLQTTSFTATPRGGGRGYQVEVKDSAGASLAVCDAEGTLRDRNGVVLLAPLRWHGAGSRATDVGIEVNDEFGRPVGAGRVVGYAFGPAARKVTVAVTDAAGRDVARLEPRDRKGQQLALHAGGTDVALVAVTQVKSGFLRRSRSFSVRAAVTLPEELRSLLLALAVRYDALLSAAQRVEQPDA